MSPHTNHVHLSVNPCGSIKTHNIISHDTIFSLHVKAKAVPLCHEGAWAERSIALLIIDLVTRWGEWSASRPGRALAPGKGFPVPTVQDAGWLQSQSGHRGERKNPFASVRDQTSTDQSSSL
jgi:hypothetical protein